MIVLWWWDADWAVAFNQASDCRQSIFLPFFCTSIQNTKNGISDKNINGCPSNGYSRFRIHFPVCYPPNIAWKYQNILLSSVTSHSHYPSSLCSLPPQFSAPALETEGFWCCPRQWTIWVISCAPVSYDFVLRQRCSRAFCLAGLSHGSQTSLFLPFPFHVAMCEWDESAAIVAWFSDLSIGSNDWGFDVQC